jgi:periplasmic protein CpxP/Spy
MTKLRTSLLSAALFTGVAALGLTPALAEAAPAPANAAAAGSEAHHHGQAWLTPGQLVDGRIAFLKTELKITPAQEGEWQQYAAVMRQNAQSLDQAIANSRQHQGGAMNAVQRMEIRGQFAKIRAENQARLLTAFRPLYASLSPEQQQVANALMTPHHGWHHRA